LLLRLANLLTQLARYRDAIEILEKGIQTHPSFEDLWANLGFVYTCRLESPQLAIAVLERGLQENAPALRIRNNLAYALLLTGHPQRAREVLGPTLRFIETDPPDLKSRSLRVYLLATWGLLVIREGHFEKGMELYRQALGLAAGDLQRRVQQKIHVEEARHEIAAGRPDRAERLLQKAIRSNADPEFTKEARQLSGSTYRQ
jgi:tetratricopeptide (TPR) repeat protein